MVRKFPGGKIFIVGVTFGKRVAFRENRTTQGRRGHSSFPWRAPGDLRWASSYSEAGTEVSARYL